MYTSKHSAVCALPRWAAGRKGVTDVEGVVVLALASSASASSSEGGSGIPLRRGHFSLDICPRPRLDELNGFLVAILFSVIQILLEERFHFLSRQSQTSCPIKQPSVARDARREYGCVYN